MNAKFFDHIYSHYGRECKCCGETEPIFLTLDHINDDGSAQRRKAAKKKYRRRYKLALLYGPRGIKDGHLAR